MMPTTTTHLICLWCTTFLLGGAFACRESSEKEPQESGTSTESDFTSDSDTATDTDVDTDSDTDTDADTDTDTDTDADATFDSETQAEEAASCAEPSSEWLLCEDFETQGGDFDQWLSVSDFISGVGDDDRGRVTIDSSEAHGGSFALYMPAAASSGYQGGSLDWRACDGEQRSNCSMRGYDQLYFRAWVRFAEDHLYVHHFLNIGGSQPDDYWYHGTAGCLPNGELSMGTTVDFEENTHKSFFYTYSPDMDCDTRCERYADVDAICAECESKGLPTCTEQKQCCWGNSYQSDTPHYFEVGKWFCLEMMMKANTPGNPDGEMAYWVDGNLVHRQQGMLWRTSPTLELNRVRLQHYITTEDAKEHSNRVWFDDIVVSTAPIGCQ